MAGTCLVIACWSGPRRQLTPAYEEDPGYFLRTQARMLSSVGHSLERVVLAVPHNEAEPAAFREALRVFPRDVGGAAVEVFERGNHGLSYGSWDDVLHETWRDHDHHVLIEDDYVFVEDCFDSTLADWIDSDPSCGYLCGLVQQSGRRRFAGISNGILRSGHYAAAAAATGGRMPYTAGQEPGVGWKSYLDEGGQIAWGNAWEAGGKHLRDMTSRYSVPWYMNGWIRCVPHESGRFLVVPVQLLEWIEAGVPEARGVGQPGQERTMIPYPPPAWFHEQVSRRGVPAC